MTEGSDIIPLDMVDKELDNTDQYDFLEEKVCCDYLKSLTTNYLLTNSLATIRELTLFKQLCQVRAVQGILKFDFNTDAESVYLEVLGHYLDADCYNAIIRKLGALEPQLYAVRLTEIGNQWLSYFQTSSVSKFKEHSEDMVNKIISDNQTFMLGEAHVVSEFYANSQCGTLGTEQLSAEHVKLTFESPNSEQLPTRAEEVFQILLNATKPIQGKEICTRARGLCNSTLTKHIIPILKKKRGVINMPGAGYYIKQRGSAL